MKLTSCEIEAGESDISDPVRIKISFVSDSAESRTWKFLLVLDTVFAQEPIPLGEVVTEDSTGNLEFSSQPLPSLAEYPANLLDNIGLLEISCGSEVVVKFPVILSRKGGAWKRQIFVN